MQHYCLLCKVTKSAYFGEDEVTSSADKQRKAVTKYKGTKKAKSRSAQRSAQQYLLEVCE